MTRIRFENLPSTNTPRTAENLNKLNNVVISSTEPNTGEEVWLQKSKNLFKYSGISSQSTYICPCKAGDVFTLSFTGSTTSSDVRLFLRTYNGDFTTSLDSYVDNQVINLSSTSNNYSKTITSTTNGFVYIRTASSYINYTLNNIQLEKGSTATTYEEFKPHKIYENKDGSYDLFTETVSVGNTAGSGSVNFIKGKNLFDKNTPNIFNGFWQNNTLLDDNNAKGVYIKCKPNTTYTISKTAGKTFRIATTNLVPNNNVATLSSMANHTGTSITITTENNANYIWVNYFNANNGDTGTYTDMMASIQIEQGSSATSLELYVDRAIVVDGEEIYNKSKTKIKTEIMSNVTLNGNGNVTTNIDRSKYAIVSVDDDAATIYCTPFSYSGQSKWMLHYYKMADGSPASNEQPGTIKIYYMEIN